MFDFAFAAHSGTRYLVLLAGGLTALYALVGLIKKGPVDRLGMGLLRGFAILIDLQVLFGLLTLLSMPFYSALIGHLVLMVAAAAVVHLGLVRVRQLPAEQRGWGTLLATAAVPLLLILGGILAIQRPII